MIRRSPLSAAAIAWLAIAWLAPWLGLGAAFAAEPTARADSPARADVLAVQVDGAPGRYRFRVTLRSPDVGCERYASWWEIVRPDGSLVFRRILMHSHPQEQPFTRTGGPVNVAPDETLIVRGHLHPPGYGGTVLRGSVAGGFEPWPDVPADFAAALAASEPQPKECWR